MEIKICHGTKSPCIVVIEELIEYIKTYKGEAFDPNQVIHARYSEDYESVTCSSDQKSLAIRKI